MDSFSSDQSLDEAGWENRHKNSSFLVYQQRLQRWYWCRNSWLIHRLEYGCHWPCSQKSWQARYRCTRWLIISRKKYLWSSSRVDNRRIEYGCDICKNVKQGFGQIDCRKRGPYRPFGAWSPSGLIRQWIAGETLYNGAKSNSTQRQSANRDKQRSVYGADPSCDRVDGCIEERCDKIRSTTSAVEAGCHRLVTYGIVR